MDGREKARLIEIDRLDAVTTRELALLLGEEETRGVVLSNGRFLALEESRGGGGWVEVTWNTGDRLSPVARAEIRVESRICKLCQGDFRQYFFVCPETGRRCRKLYLVGKYRLASRLAVPFTYWGNNHRKRGGNKTRRTAQ